MSYQARYLVEMPSRVKSFRVKIGGEMWTVRMKKPPTSSEYDADRRLMYLDPSKIKKKGIEYWVSAILAVRFRHFMTPTASKDAARVINRAYEKMLSKKPQKTLPQ